MSRTKALSLYLIGAFTQIGAACIMVYLLRSAGTVVDFSTLPGLIAVAVGGTSTAIWGSVAAYRYFHRKPLRVLTDFFKFRQSISDYALAAVFLALDFLPLFFGGELNIGAWYLPFVLFAKMLLFGGIEEIGWRYIFQPILEEKLGYIFSTLITFISWGVWHFAFFYIDGTLAGMSGADMLWFSLGLLTNCFILSALYNRSKNLWLCAMTHALINVLSLMAVGGSRAATLVCQAAIIVIAVVVSRKSRIQAGKLTDEN